MANLTLSVDDDIIRAAKIYAAANGTSISQMVREFLSSLNAVGHPDPLEAVLIRYSQGQGETNEVLRTLNVDYGTLIVMMSKRALPMPRVSDEMAKAMAKDFVQVLGVSP